MSFLGSILGPVAGLNMLKTAIESNVGHKVETYTIHISIADKKMRIDIDGTPNPYTNDTVFSLIETMVAGQLEDGAKLLAASITHGKEIEVVSYFEKNGEKMKKV